MIALDDDGRPSFSILQNYGSSKAPVLYFVWVWYKGSLGLVDAGVLLAMYVGYLAILWRFPPRNEESVRDVPAVERKRIGAAARSRVLAEHTPDRRAAQLIHYVHEALSPRIRAVRA